MRICGICDKELNNDDKIVACNKCNGLYHLDCFEDLGGCANPYCDNYVAPSLSLAQLSQICDTDEENIDDIDKNDVEEDYNDNYSEIERENEEDYEISDEDDNENEYEDVENTNENINGFKDTPPQKSSSSNVLEWMIYIGLIAVTIFLLFKIF